MRYHFRKILLLKACIILAMSLPAAAYGYSLWCGEHNNGVSYFEVNPNFGDTCAGSTTDQIEAMRAAAEEWTVAGEACFEFIYGGQTSISYASLYDDHNVIYATSESGGGALAATMCDGYSVDHGWDMVFYDHGISLCLGSRYDIQGIAVHELGHALGLGHTSGCSVSCSSRPTMCASICSTGTSERTLEADDIAGIQAIYGYCPNCWDDDGDGYDDDVCMGNDCNDSNPNIHPCATEICGNGYDDDCIDGDRACDGGVMEVNPNESAVQALSLGTVSGTTVAKGSLCTVGFSGDYSGDLDYYRFTAPSPGYDPTIEITLEWAGTGDFDIRLFGGDGVTFIKGSYVHDPETITQVLSPGSSYVILVAGKSEPGDYTLSIAAAGSCWDADGDGYSDEACGGTDCDDADPAISPGADEDCGDGIDNDCDGWIDYSDPECTCPDGDGDGYSDEVCGGTDCDDSDPAISPGADEDCGDGIDNNCDGLADEADPDCCTDGDGDGYALEGGGCGQVDCDDSDPAVYPSATEICDGIDNNCDSDIPETEADADGDTWRICSGDCDDTDLLINPGRPEVPGNGKDDDCDGLIDEQGPCGASPAGPMGWTGTLLTLLLSWFGLRLAGRLALRKN